MIDADRLELIDTGDGVPLSKCEQNLYEVLACQEDGFPYDPQRIYDAFEDMNELVAEVKRLRKENECMRFDIEHAIDHSWPSWEDLKVYLKEMI